MLSRVQNCPLSNRMGHDLALVLPGLEAAAVDADDIFVAAAAFAACVFVFVFVAAAAAAAAAACFVDSIAEPPTAAVDVVSLLPPLLLPPPPPLLLPPALPWLVALPLSEEFADCVPGDNCGSSCFNANIAP